MIPGVDRIEFTDADKATPLWTKLVAYQKQRLDALRIQNDGDKDVVATAKLRGQIAEVKILLNHDKDKPVVD